MITDANILQGPLFHEEDIGADDQQADIDIDATSNPQGTPATGPVVLKLGTQSTNAKVKKSHSKPAAHRVCGRLVYFKHMKYTCLQVYVCWFECMHACCQSISLSLHTYMQVCAYAHLLYLNVYVRI